MNSNLGTERNQKMKAAGSYGSTVSLNYIEFGTCSYIY
jgi:hypothetical protein